MIQLYGIRQSRAMRSSWALEELGLPYEHAPTNFTPDANRPSYLAINPNGRIPALVDGDVTLFESMAIVARWLGECCCRPSFAKAQRG